MKVIALVFDYNLDKVIEVGRRTAKTVYKNKDFIFEYSAASYATFIEKNPVTKLNIYTDDIDLMYNKLSKYSINLNNIIFHDYSERLKQYVNLDYCFRILFDAIKENHSFEEYTVKIDNDMIFLDSIPDMSNNDNRVLVWKREHYVDTGNPLWGEKKACQIAIGTTHFHVSNIGLLGLPINMQMNEAEETMNGLVGVDISDVTDVGSKIYHCCEQTAWNWIFHKYNYEIIETYQYVRHHFVDKINCIAEARYLLK